MARAGSGRVLATAREQFLTAERFMTGVVRDEIAASWRRSHEFWGLDASRIEPPYRPDVDADVPLVHAADPILDRLHNEVDGAGMTVILTDSAGYVLRRIAGGKSLSAHLDSVHLAPGFCYSEKHVGTNGIGVALEERQAARVFGHEHYAEGLESLSCAAMPVRNPLTGKVEGAINLTCFDDTAGALMVSVVQAAARDIEQRLLEQRSQGEQALLTEFLAVSAHARGAVIATTRDIMMTNDAAQRLKPHDLSLLRQAVLDVLGRTTEEVVDLDLSAGRAVRVRVRPVIVGTRSTGAIADVARRRRRRSARRDARRSPRLLSFLVGTHPLWLEACREVEEHCTSRTPLLLLGEPGVGKRSLAMAIHEQERPAVPLTLVDVGTLDAATAHRELSALPFQHEGTVVLCHLDRMGSSTAEVVERTLARWSSSAHAPWVVATLEGTAREDDSHRNLFTYFTASVVVPPLRQRKTDIGELVTYLLGRGADQDRSIDYEPDVVPTLMRYQWPGNVAELDRVLRVALEHRPVGRIRLQDLPSEFHMKEPRLLTTLEELERDAIVRALRENDDNRVAAASSLGISRATLYRKMDAYEIGSNETY